MPFCVIFFVISLLYLLIMRTMRVDTILLSTITLCMLISVFVGEVVISDTIRINVLFFASIFLLVCYYMFKVKASVRLSAIFLSLILAVVYFILLQYNIFWSVDYYIYFALALFALLPIIFSRNIQSVIFAVSFSIAALSLCEIIFWKGELQYIELNILNILNVYTILLSFGIVVYLIRTKARRIEVGHETGK